ncbi:MAG: hypothetical protein VKK05_08915 [Synechococcus sp.]|jgi:hypothetical protein|nr:hypothetical protein [Synechococcus sp.]
MPGGLVPQLLQRALALGAQIQQGTAQTAELLPLVAAVLPAGRGCSRGVVHELLQGVTQIHQELQTL